MVLGGPGRAQRGVPRSTGCYEMRWSGLAGLIELCLQLSRLISGDRCGHHLDVAALGLRHEQRHDDAAIRTFALGEGRGSVHPSL